MVQHGDYISDGSKSVRVAYDENGNVVRFLLTEELYGLLEPFYNSFEMISAVIAVKVKQPPEFIEECLELVSSFIFEINIGGLILSVSLVNALAAYLVKKKIDIAKFTYKTVGWGKDWNRSWGGGTKIQELSEE